MSVKDTFKRKEKKFLLTCEQYEQLLSLISEHVQADDYHHSDIHSLYYDTPSYDIINRSLEKPVYKEKLRVRDYGTGEVFVELKKKYKGIVYKRRILVPRQVASAWLDEGFSFAEAMQAAGVTRELTYREKQISAEIDAFIARYGNDLTPAMDIHADRYSFREKDSADPIRLTFDVGIWYEDKRDCREGGEVRLTDFVVMETKVGQAYPLWLASALSQMRLFPSSFSKYGTAYKQIKCEKTVPVKEERQEVEIVPVPSSPSKRVKVRQRVPFRLPVRRYANA